MLNALAAFTEGGGRLMYLGGDGFYWRIAFSTDLPGVIEVRRAGGTRCWDSEPGELYFGFSAEPGGLWRHVGRPPQQLAGVGFVSMGFDRSSCYHRQPDSFNPLAAFIFEGIGEDEVIGDFGLIGGGARTNLNDLIIQVFVSHYRKTLFHQSVMGLPYLITMVSNDSMVVR